MTALSGSDVGSLQRFPRCGKAVCSTGFLRRLIRSDPPRTEAYRPKEFSHDLKARGTYWHERSHNTCPTLLRATL
jgi:hypothetical protein